MKRNPLLVWLLLSALPLLAQTQFKLALPQHNGQLRWSAEGYKIAQNSAKPGGREIGIRATDSSGRHSLLGFLFLFPEEAPMNSAKCRDGVMGPTAKADPSMKVLESTETASQVALVNYSNKGKNAEVWYHARGFVASGDVCGDLELSSRQPIHLEDAGLKAIFDSYVLDTAYQPVFRDIFLYAQVLFDAQRFKDAAPLYEAALAKVNDGSSTFPSLQTARRVTIDQAGMSYGIAGDLPKSRAILGKGIAEDPDYPMFYYNLACADAQEQKLGEAQTHLKAAFDRKVNVISGEKLPDPTKDDSFIPYRNNQKFWSFVEKLQAGR